ncbi:pantetheinase-like isoform X2 [Mya arenaria]|nr:pantetheinase-like isoform X2 [Mya arenaria]
MQPFLEDVPDPAVAWNPCEDPERFAHTSVLRYISCAAKNSSIYIIANMGDVKQCDVHKEKSCPSDGRYQFNTNVVFSATGNLVARYHKRHMYDETPLFDPSPTDEYVTFETPFGKFGTVVCFDLLHYYPTQELILKHGVRNIIVTSAWNVFYPFVTPLQMYAGLSKRNHVTVIAANIRNHEYGMAGSGIFSPESETSTSTDFMSSQGALLISEVNTDTTTNDVLEDLKSFGPISKIRSNLNESYTDTYDYGMNMTFAVLEGQSGFVATCFDNVCCAVQFQFRERAIDEMYILSASDFANDYPGIIHLQFCAIHRCSSQQLDSCGEAVFDTSSIFSFLKLQAYFDPGVLFPFASSSASDNFQFYMEQEKYSFDEKAAILQSSSFDRPMLAVVLFNSLYEDEPHMGMSSRANSVTAHLLIQVFVFISQKFILKWSVH